MTRESKLSLVALLSMSSCCYFAVSVLCFFLMVQWTGLQCVSVAFPAHTHTHVHINDLLYEKIGLRGVCD